MSTPTLTEFLLARIAEDEAVAREGDPWATGDVYDDRVARWNAQPHAKECGWKMGEGISSECACGYPSRVLAECEAKRRIVDLAKREAYFSGGLSGIGASLLLALASVYSDHPDYRAEWTTP